MIIFKKGNLPYYKAYSLVHSTPQAVALPNLTLTERVTLANQFYILSLIDKQNADDHENKAEILTSGYTGLYDRIFDSFSEADPASVTTEAIDIMEMFWVLKNNIEALKPEDRTQLNLPALTFDGFDGNHDPHYSQAKFIVKRLGLFEELKKHGMNSHSRSSLPKYRRMLSVYNRIINAPEGFTLENLKLIQAA